MGLVIFKVAAMCNIVRIFSPFFRHCLFDFQNICNILRILCFDMCLVIFMVAAKFQGYFHLSDRCYNFPRLLLLYFIHWSRHEKSHDNGEELSRKILKIVEILWLTSRSFGCRNLGNCRNWFYTCHGTVEKCSQARKRKKQIN